MTSNSLSKQDVLKRADQLDFPSSVVEFFQGYLGQPYGGFPEPLRTKVIRNKPRIDGRPGSTMGPLELKKIKTDLRSRFGKHITDSDVMSYVMYPKVTSNQSYKTYQIRGAHYACRSSKNTRASSNVMEI